MTLPAAPLPSLRALCLAVAGRRRDSLKPWLGARGHRRVEFYSAARFALSAAIAGALERRGRKSGVVWLPDYICDEAVSPLRGEALTLRFYRIREDLSPDWASLNAEAAIADPADVFVLVHYFGVPNSVAEARSFCASVGADLVEDCAHVLVPTNGCGEATSIFSPRKLLALPEGGLLVGNENDGHGGVKESFGRNPAFVGRWIAKRLAQKMMIASRVSWHGFRNDAAASEDEEIASAGEVVTARPDKYSLRLLGVLAKDIPAVIARRRDNYFSLLRAVAGSDDARALYPSLAEGICPYAFPLIFQRRRDELNARLRSRGVPSSDWPNLPAEILAEGEAHRVAIDIQRRILLLPVHQDLGEKDIEVMAEELRAFAASRAA